MSIYEDQKEPMDQCWIYGYDHIYGSVKFLQLSGTAEEIKKHYADMINAELHKRYPTIVWIPEEETVKEQGCDSLILMDARAFRKEWSEMISDLYDKLHDTSRVEAAAQKELMKQLKITQEKVEILLTKTNTSVCKYDDQAYLYFKGCDRKKLVSILHRKNPKEPEPFVVDLDTHRVIPVREVSSEGLPVIPGTQRRRWERLLKYRKMSQSDLAERAGVSKQVISALVTKGSLEKASVATALGIAKALDMDINELVRRICGSSAK